MSCLTNDIVGLIDMSLLTDGSSSGDRRRKEELKRAVLASLDELASAGQSVRLNDLVKKIREGASEQVENAEFLEVLRSSELEGAVQISGEGMRRMVKRVVGNF
jgi:DNA replication licensing factor MCM4